MKTFVDYKNKYIVAFIKLNTKKKTIRNKDQNKFKFFGANL